MSNLAGVLSDQGKYEQAEEMHRQALGLRETVLGKEHSDTLTSIYNLAYVLSNRKRFSTANKLHATEVHAKFRSGPPCRYVQPKSVNIC
jgi:hypothetical protein